MVSTLTKGENMEPYYNVETGYYEHEDGHQEWSYQDGWETPDLPMEELVVPENEGEDFYVE